MKTALITGITGQDGAYLARLLLDKGYRVIGATRTLNSANLKGLHYLGIQKEVEILECDFLDHAQTIGVFKTHQPDEVYNLAAQSSVSLSFRQPIGTMQYNTLSVLHQLEAIKLVNQGIRFYQASSSEMYGRVANLPVKEDMPLYPLSPYAISKAAAHWSAINYRESYQLFVACGILFNHESYLRNTNFFVKKVIRNSIEIKKGTRRDLQVGNIDIKRDFGYAPAYVEAMWLMLQQEEAADFLICSGQSLSLRNIILHIFDRLGVEADRLIIDPALYRPTDIEDMYGSTDRARTQLGWLYDYDFYQVLDILLEEEQQNYAE